MIFVTGSVCHVILSPVTLHIHVSARVSSLSLSALGLTLFCFICRIVLFYFILLLRKKDIPSPHSMRNIYILGIIPHTHIRNIKILFVHGLFPRNFHSLLYSTLWHLNWCMIECLAISAVRESRYFLRLTHYSPASAARLMQEWYVDNFSCQVERADLRLT